LPDGRIRSPSIAITVIGPAADTGFQNAGTLQLKARVELIRHADAAMNLNRFVPHLEQGLAYLVFGQ